MTRLQTLALHFFDRASSYRLVLHDAQQCRLERRWQRELWTLKETCIIDATILAPELFFYTDDERHPEMVRVVCRKTGMRMHFPKRKTHLLNCPLEA